MKKKIIVSSIVIGVLLVFCLAMIGVKARYKKQEEQKNILKIQAINAEKVLRDLAVYGEVVIQDGSVIITGLNFNDTELLLRINYYNGMEEKSLTLEQLKEQFGIYIITYEFCDENTEELDLFCRYVEENSMYAYGTSDYDMYVYKVAMILAEMGTEKWEATREQLEEACQKALEELGFI